MTDLISKCGMNCAHCPWSQYVRETIKTDEDYQQFRERCRKVLGYRPTDAYQNCVGCQTPDKEIPKEARIPLRNCLVRQCVDKIGVKNCAYCSRFPCGYVKDHGTSWSREKIEEKHGAPILEEDYLTFVEPFEGLKHLESIRASLNPEQIVEAARVPPLKIRVIDFPKDLPFSHEEVSAFKTLHRLLTNVKHSSLGLTDTDTFAQQQRLKNRIPHFLRFLWILGHFGDFKTEDGAYLVVDAKTYIDNRGSEKTLATWSFVKGVIFKNLSEFGVRCERVALEEVNEEDITTPTGALRKKGWIMTMSFDDATGGVAALKALQTYTKKLNEKYSKKAFKYFSDVDMRALREE